MRKTRKNGGAATVFPLKYFNDSIKNVSSSNGHDLLQVSGRNIRPSIGGRRKTHTYKYRKNKKTSGGFIPTIMDGFVKATSKYIVPVALFAGYKLMSRNGIRVSQKKTKPAKPVKPSKRIKSYSRRVAR